MLEINVGFGPHRPEVSWELLLRISVSSPFCLISSNTAGSRGSEPHGSRYDAM